MFEIREESNICGRVSRVSRSLSVGAEGRIDVEDYLFVLALRRM